MTTIAPSTTHASKYLTGDYPLQVLPSARLPPRGIQTKSFSAQGFCDPLPVYRHQNNPSHSKRKVAIPQTPPPIFFWVLRAYRLSRSLTTSHLLLLLLLLLLSLLLGFKRTPERLFCERLIKEAVPSRTKREITNAAHTSQYSGTPSNIHLSSLALHSSFFFFFFQLPRLDPTINCSLLP